MDRFHPNSPDYDESAAEASAGAEAAVEARVQASLDRAALIRAGRELNAACEQQQRLLRNPHLAVEASQLEAAEARVRAARNGYRILFEIVTGIDWRGAIVRLIGADLRIAA
jgi:hypothetical protein